MSKQSLHNIKLQRYVKRIKPSVLSYLYEIASIPQDIRHSYLQKLLKRKNSPLQKNVELLKMLCCYVEQDRMMEWDETAICRRLRISKDMLYCHKSRILKALRLMYFDWKNVEQEKLYNPERYTDKFALMYLRIEKMTRIGMWREAKCEFIKLERIINAQSKKNVWQKYVLANVMKQLLSYYYHRENAFKFNLYHKKLKDILSKLIKNPQVKNNKELQLKVSIIQCYLKNFDSLFKVKRPDQKDTEENFNRIVSIVKKVKIPASYASALLDAGIFYKTRLNYGKALECLIKGERFSRKHKLKKEEIVFRMYILLVRLNMGEYETGYVLKEVLRRYELLKRLNVRGYLKERALINCNELTSVQEDKSLSHRYLMEYNSHYILTWGYYGAVRTLYFMKFNYYQNKIKRFRIEKFAEKKIPVLYGVNPVYQKKLNDTTNELVQNFQRAGNNRLMNIHFRWEASMAILDAEFWKGTELSIDYARYIIRGLDWLKKSWGKLVERDVTVYQALKLCISIIEDSKHLSKRELLNKYEFRFKKTCGEIINSVNENVLGLYSIISYTSQITGYKEMKMITAKTYFSLRRKYPEVFRTFLNELKNKTGRANMKSFRSIESKLTDKAA